MVSLIKNVDFSAIINNYINENSITVVLLKNFFSQIHFQNQLYMQDYSDIKVKGNLNKCKIHIG